MKKYVIILLILFTCQLTRAQDVVRASQVFPEHKYLELQGKVYFKENIQIRGSEFLWEDWQQGNIIFNNGVVLKNVKFKLDVFKHQVIVYQDYLNRLVLMNKSDIDGFVLNDQIEFIKINDLNLKAKKMDGCFVQVLAKGDISLYKFYFKEVLPLSEMDPPYITEYYNHEEYYVQIHGEYFETGLNKRVLKRKLPDFKSQIKQFIRREKLKLKREDDFAKLIQYLNTL